MGAWLAKYGDTIYATRGGPYKPGKWGASSRKGNTIYLHVFKWNDDTLTLPALSKKITGSKLLTGGIVKVEQTDDAITITVPVKDQHEIDTVIELTLDGSALDIEPLSVSGGRGLPAKASNTFHNQADYAADKAFDDDEQTRWATDAGTTSAWIEVALPFAKTIATAAILQEPTYANRIEAYEFQAEQDGAWKTLCTGERLKAKETLKFEPVTAKKFRLNITKASEGPTINEIELR
jgi:alpha-L-fucosidase